MYSIIYGVCVHVFNIRFVIICVFVSFNFKTCQFFFTYLAKYNRIILLWHPLLLFFFLISYNLKSKRLPFFNWCCAPWSSATHCWAKRGFCRTLSWCLHSGWCWCATYITPRKMVISKNKRISVIINKILYVKKTFTQTNTFWCEKTCINK